MTRELLTVRTVSATMVTELGTRFGYLALSQFGKDSAQEVRNALVEMLKSNAEGIVLDLRNNPGGFVPASRETAGLFLSGKAVLYHSIDRTGSAKDFESTGAPLISESLVIIVNGATASAAEMLAAPLQDNHRTMLIGNRNFRARANPFRAASAGRLRSGDRDCTFHHAGGKECYAPRNHARCGGGIKRLHSRD